LLSLTLDLIRLHFRGSMLFCIEKPHDFVTTLLSLENWCLPSIWLGFRGSRCFGVYIVYFAFLLHFFILT
jgi:hypothetical protein